MSEIAGRVNPSPLRPPLRLQLRQQLLNAIFFFERGDPVIHIVSQQFGLSLPDGYFAVYMMGLGYPDDRPLRPLVRPDRRPFDEVVHWGHW